MRFPVGILPQSKTFVNIFSKKNEDIFNYMQKNKNKNI